ncbi:MAG: acetyl-CoA C-acetyltransferase [Gemmataceae bacterium]|nr:acetyl-CoA C-acetyltransferase [Gemmataceae bacterium]MCI0741830.1 acetyl-CoA C-acetyltransferase [Gemmataceae bacterium]
MAEAFVLSAVRTPIGKYLGGLAEVSAPALAALALAEALRRGRAQPSQIDEVIVGNVIQAGLGQNPARQAALKAGLPDTIAAVTINKVCGSGLKAVMLAAQAIRAGDAELVLAGGMESMSRAPHLLFNTRTGWKYGDQKAADAMIHDGLWCAFEGWHMGEAAEHIAIKCGVSRAEQDRFAAQSQHRAAAAWDKGLFNAEVLPVTVGNGPKAKTLSRDESFRPDTTTEGLAKLKPAFNALVGTVTAGNSSTLSDGAAAILVGSAKAAEKLGTKPLARVVAYATSGVAPKDIFIAPVLAVRQVLEKAGLALRDIDLFELNEAFAAQMLACGKELGLDESRVNVHGGAIALGHPIGASGTRVLVTLLHALEERGGKRGLASLCLGGGNAVAMVVER